MAPAARFPSKRDWWLVLLLGAGVIVLVAGGVFQLQSAATPVMRIILLMGCLAAAALLIWVLYGTTYTFAGDILRVRSGPFRFTVPLADIESVTPSRNPLSSPACSLDRLDIRYRSGRSILLSPQDKAAFLRTVVERCPHLALAGDRVVRAGASPPSRTSTSARPSQP